MAARDVQGSSRNQISASRRIDPGRDASFLWSAALAVHIRRSFYDEQPTLGRSTAQALIERRKLPPDLHHLSLSELAVCFPLRKGSDLP
jgi:hypothetical protein